MMVQTHTILVTFQLRVYDVENKSTFVDTSGKRIMINIDDEIKLENLPDYNTSENFKDAQLASLYAQVEFLKSEMAEKNLVIRTLLNNESGDINNNTSDIKDINSTVEQIYVNDPISVSNDDGETEISDGYFLNLYSQYVRDMREREENKI